MVLQNDFTSLLRTPLGNWVIIISLVATLVGWGINTRANTAELEKKADKATVEAQLAAMRQDLQEIKTDVREIRNNQARVRVDLVEQQALDARATKNDKVVLSNQ